MSTFTIATTQPSPSMNQDTVQFEGTYVEAVEAARASWRETRRHTTVSAGTVAINPYHSIRRDGTFTDRNTNSGVPSEGNVDELDAPVADEDRPSALTREQRTELSKLWSREPNLSETEYARRDELEAIMKGDGPRQTAPTAGVAAAALGDRIAGELGAAEGSSERLQATRLIAAELSGLLLFVERAFGASIENAGTGENEYEATIRRDAGNLLTRIANR